MEKSLKYPIGKFKLVEKPKPHEINEAINVLARFPEKLELKLKDLKFEDFLKNYRQKSWNIKQIVHHLAESHMHCYLRIKYAIVEDTPHIKDYNENDWAKIPDSMNINILDNLELIRYLHAIWVNFLKNLSVEQFNRTYINHEKGKEYTVGSIVLLYAWHCNHHLAHIDLAINK